jgi:hypothetical protein
MPKSGSGDAAVKIEHGHPLLEKKPWIDVLRDEMLRNFCVQTYYDIP